MPLDIEFIIAAAEAAGWSEYKWRSKYDPYGDHDEQVRAGTLALERRGRVSDLEMVGIRVNYIGYNSQNDTYMLEMVAWGRLKT